MEFENISRDYQHAMSLYHEQITDLERKIGKRQALLEKIDADVGAISDEPELAEHFVKKQALLINNFKHAKELLCETIRGKLQKSIEGNPKRR
jgi:hypothetical protein